MSQQPVTIISCNVPYNIVIMSDERVLLVFVCLLTVVHVFVFAVLMIVFLYTCRVHINL